MWENCFPAEWLPATSKQKGGHAAPNGPISATEYCPPRRSHRRGCPGSTRGRHLVLGITDPLPDQIVRLLYPAASMDGASCVRRGWSGVDPRRFVPGARHVLDIRARIRVSLPVGPA